jgi:predicted dienelactone hydrolase
VSYDPFSRGAFPVGVRALEWTDLARARTLPVELWYPATEEWRGRDLDPEHQDRYQVLPIGPAVTQAAVRDAEPRPGRYPLVIFSHGLFGHRRQTTHLCTHLASHGYVVASLEHVGSATADVIRLLAGMQQGRLPDPAEILAPMLPERAPDVSFAIDRILGGDAEALSDLVDPERIGAAGHSFGGWTTLSATGRDPRIRAALPLAPAGAGSPHLLRDPLREALALDWERKVPTLFVVADGDSLLPLEGMHELWRRTPGATRLVVLKNADHMHFCDRVEETHELFRMFSAMRPVPVVGAPSLKPASELCPGEHAYALLQGLGLAHMDAHLRACAEAEALLDDAQDVLARRGIEAEVF